MKITLKEAKALLAAAGYEEGETPSPLPRSFVNRTRMIKEGSLVHDPETMKCMTKTQAIVEIRAMGMQARGTGKEGEIRVNFPHGEEETAYYTEDPEDAVCTAIKMKSGGVQ